LVAIFALVIVSCASSKPASDAGTDGGEDAMMAVDAGKSDAQGEAGCARPSGSNFPCASDSDCPAPQPPQYLPHYCCGNSFPAPGTCAFPSIGGTMCTLGGCTTDTFQCDATSATTGDWHMCASNADCPTQRCCTVCRIGFAFSMCMSTAEATKDGAACM